MAIYFLRESKPLSSLWYLQLFSRIDAVIVRNQPWQTSQAPQNK